MTINETKISDALAEIAALSTVGTLPVGTTLMQTAWDHEEPYEREVLIHFFASTVEAYDASQCDDNIIDGDLLAIPSEGVLGILIEAWPTAITVNHGEFHRRAASWDQIESGRYNEAVKAAESIIAQWDGTEVAPDADDWGAASAAEITTVEPWQPVVRIAWYERDGDDIAREPGGLEWTMIASAEFEGKSIARVVRTDHKNRILIATVTDCLLTDIIVGTEHDVWYIKREKSVGIIAAALTNKRLAEAAAQVQQGVTTEQIQDLLEPVDPKFTTASAHFLDTAARAIMERDEDVEEKVTAYASHLGLLIPEAMRDVSARWYELASTAADGDVGPLEESALTTAAMELIVGHPTFVRRALTLLRLAMLAKITDGSWVTIDDAERAATSYRDYLASLDDDQSHVPDYDTREQEAREMVPVWDALAAAESARVEAEFGGDWSVAESKLHDYALAAGLDWNEALERVARGAAKIVAERLPEVITQEEITEVIALPETIIDRLIRTPRWAMILLAAIILGSVIFIDVTVIAPALWRAIEGFWGANVHVYHGLNSGIVIGGPKAFVGFEWHGQPGPFACVLGHGMCG